MFVMVTEATTTALLPFRFFPCCLRHTDDVADGVLGNDVTTGAATADGEILKEDFFFDLAEAGRGLEVDFHRVGFAALGRVAGNVEDAGAGLAFGQVVFLIAGHAAGGEVLGERGARLAVAIDHAVGQRVRLGSVEDVDVQNILTEEGFVADLANDEFALLVDSNDVVEVRALADGFILLHADAGEAFLFIDVKGLVGDDDVLRDDPLEGSELGLTLAACAVFLLQVGEPLDRVFGEVFKVLLGRCDVVFEPFDQLVGFEGVELGDALDLDFKQAKNVVLRDLALEEFLVGLEAFIDGGDDGFPSFLFFDAAVDAFLDEDLLQGAEVPLLFELTELDLEFELEQVTRLLGGEVEQILSGEEVRLLVFDHADVGRYGQFAIGEGVERLLDGLGVGSGGQIDKDLDDVGGIILDALDFDLALFVGRDDRIDQAGSRLAKRKFGDGELEFAALFDAGANFDATTALAVVVFGHVGDAAGREVGHELGLFLAQERNAAVEKLDKIVRENLAGKANGDALGTLREEEREFDREGVGFFVASVVRREPVGRLRVKDNIEGESGKTRFDVAGSCGGVAGQGVPPVTLHVDEEFLLPELHHGIADRGVTVRVILHGVTDHVGHLVVAAVFQLAHGVEDTALHRLEAVIGVWHSALQNHVAGVVEEPVAKHVVDVPGIGLDREELLVRKRLGFDLGRWLIKFKFKVVFLRRLFAGHGACSRVGKWRIRRGGL